MNTSEKLAVTREQIHKTLWELAAKHAEKDAKDLRPQDRLKEDLGFDSLDLAEIAMELEDNLDVTVPDEIMDKEGLTLGDVEQALCSRLQS